MRVRRLPIATAAVAGLLAAAAVVFVASFDVNRYKPELVEAVRDRTGRVLSIDGELSLSLLPRLGLAIGPARLSGPGGHGEFAQFDAAQIGVALWPLLSRRLVIERVSLEGLKLEAVRRRDGSTNFDDLLRRARGVAAANAHPAPAAAAAALSVASLQLRQATLGWRDETSGREWRLQQADLEAGRIASGTPGSLRLSGRLIGKRPLTDLAIELSSGYTVDFATLATRLAGFDLKARGNAGGASTLDARLRGEFVADPAGGPFELSDLNLALSAGHDIAGTFAGHGSIDPEREIATLSLTGTLDGSMLHAKIATSRFSPMAIRYELQADRLDLDRIRAVLEKPAADATVEGAGSETDAHTDEHARRGDTAVLPAALAGLEASGSVRIGALTLRGVHANQVTAEIRSGANRIELTRLGAAVFGGALDARATLAGSGRHALQMRLAGVDAGMALRALFGRDALNGHGDLRIDVTASGGTPSALERSLDGTAALSLRNGAIVGVDLADAIYRLQRALAAVRGRLAAIEQSSGARDRTAFSSLDASFAIRHGIVHNDDLDLRSPLLHVTGSGDIDLARKRIDCAARVTLSESSSPGDPAGLAALRGLPVPVRLSGSFDALSWRIDPAPLAIDLAKREIARRLQPPLPRRR
ncbi:MAG: AsmA family protein [Burkholderiaceae bacterium]|nr:AsmA family protein [Burkholderiaceae bacterium]